MSEKWQEGLDSYFKKMEKDLGYEEAYAILKRKENELTNRNRADEIIQSCEGNLKQQLEGRLKVIKFNSCNGTVGETMGVQKLEIEIGVLTIKLESGSYKGWYSNVEFNPPPEGRLASFEYYCDIVGNACNYYDWEGTDFLAIMKTAGLYDVTIFEFLEFLEKLGARCHVWYYNEDNEEDLDKFVKFESNAKSARSVIPPQKKQRTE